VTSLNPARPKSGQLGIVRKPDPFRRRCYIEHGDGWGCPNDARYEARLTWTFGLMLLCEDHAAEERALGDVLEIRSIPIRPAV
jgi:hypothetical protein